MESDPQSSESITTVIPFDGEGRDPTSLVGRKIKWYYKSGKGISLLTFKCHDGIVQFVNSADLIGYEEGITENNDPSWFHFDSNLQTALASLDRSGRSTCLIEEACVGTRKDGSSSYKVVGIRCQGMSNIGYIYCKKNGGISRNMFDSDDSDFEWEPDYYGDVILAASRIRY